MSSFEAFEAAHPPHPTWSLPIRRRRHAQWARATQVDPETETYADGFSSPEELMLFVDSLASAKQQALEYDAETRGPLGAAAVQARQAKYLLAEVLAEPNPPIPRCSACRAPCWASGTRWRSWRAPGRATPGACGCWATRCW